ncbi:MAG TPA: gas vesicle protein [Vicinamibacterales bacterium]|nr:gas vesicle protein [Vicinamibacterales bacterium]
MRPPPGPRRPGPPSAAKPSTVTRKSAHTTVRPPAPFEKRPARPAPSAAIESARRVHRATSPKRQVARIFDEDATLLDLIDNLLSKGVMLNADVILALANVDLVYLRLSALLCAADRVLPPFAKAPVSKPAHGIGARGHLSASRRT